jgi:MscS family membrane protein
MAIDGTMVIDFLVELVGEWIRNKYAQSLVTLIAFFLGAWLFTFIAEKYILKLTAKTKTKVDDMLVEKTHGPISLLFFILGIKVALVPLRIEEKVNIIIQHSISTISLIVLIYALINVFDIILGAAIRRRATKREAEIDENLVKLSSKTSRWILIIIGFLFILSIWDVKIGTLLASLGIIGIAVAFGLQNTLGNIFGGVSLLMDRSIKVGDIVRIDKDTAGAVIDVGLRSTRIRTWDNEVIIIPNGKLAGSNIKNYVLPNPSARIVIPFSVAYGSKVDKVKKVVMKEIKKLDNLDPGHEPAVMFIEMGDSALKFKALVWLTSYKKRFATKEKLNCFIYDALNKNKIVIPFPQVDVHLKRK